MIWVKLHEILGAVLALLGLSGAVAVLITAFSSETEDPSAGGVLLVISWSLGGVGTLLLRQAHLLRAADQLPKTAGSLGRFRLKASIALLATAFVALFPWSIAAVAIAVAIRPSVRHGGALPGWIGRAAGAVVCGAGTLLALFMFGSAVTSIPALLTEPYPSLLLFLGVLTTPLWLAPICGVILVGRAAWVLSSRRTLNVGDTVACRFRETD